MSADDDGEIEYLEEDAEIIQQYVQAIQTPAPETVSSDEDQDKLNAKIDSLLVERKIVNKRKPRPDEEDSDYDPKDDLAWKRRKVTPKKQTQPKPIPVIIPVKDPHTQAKPVDLKKRKKFKIRIPDFEDPICLPVKAVKKDAYDLKTNKIWNNLCVGQLWKNELETKPDSRRVVSSTKMVAFKAMKNKHTGKQETMVYFRTMSRDEHGEKKLEQCRGTLPHFREKRTLDYQLNPKRPLRSLTKQSEEALLTMETHNNEDLLVLYKPNDTISSVYKLVEEERDSEDLPPRRVLQETAATRMCAPCYQVSWRGAKKTRSKEAMYCKICQHTFVSVYNMLAHLKTHHKDEEVRRHKGELSRTLAKVVDYHYRCRICQQTCSTIKGLRDHVNSHKGKELFKCEIGNHMTK